MAKQTEKAAIRTANLPDVDRMKALIDRSAEQGLMLPRPLPELCSWIRDFTVSERDGAVVGCVALHVFTKDLAEIRSLVVDGEAKGSGLGKSLVEHAVAQARDLGVKQVFALTFIPEFFEKLGFRRLENKSVLPHKVWTECIRCPSFPECNEEAVILDL